MTLFSGTNARPRIWIFFLIAITVVSLALYYFSFLRPKDYIIPGVPYNGNFSGTVLTYDAQSVAAMILRYWGDKRLSFEDIKEQLPPATFTFKEVGDFFKEQGYRIEFITIEKQRDLRKFISSNKNTPIIIPLTEVLEESFTAHSFAVVIGSIETTQQVIIHASNLGNNYSMSGKDLFTETRRALVAVPSEEIKQYISGPDHSRPYPARLGIMDDPGLRNVSNQWTIINILRRQRRETPSREARIEVERAILTRMKTLTETDDFSRLHPAGQVTGYTNFALYLVKFGEYDEAIQILQQKTIPLNHDLNKPYGEWPRELPFARAFAAPWRILRLAYLGKKDQANAERALQEVLALGKRGPRPSQEEIELEQNLIK